MERLFILGAPKCGTTSLYRYLNDHPSVYFPRKEIHYFSKDFPEFQVVTSHSEYEALFSEHPDQTEILGDASVWHLYSEVAPELIYETYSEARFIVMVRNPIEMFQSLHQQKLYSRDETVENIQEAWNLQTRRKNGEKIPETCRATEHLLYKEVCSLGTQCERIKEIIPEDQLKIILFDDFVNNTKQVYDDVIQFLDLVDTQKNQFEAHNQANEWKIPWLGTLFKEVPKYYQFFTGPIRNQLGWENLGVVEFLRQFNTKKNKRRITDEDFLEQLKMEFSDEKEKIEILLDRDLSHWFNLNASCYEN